MTEVEWLTIGEAARRAGCSPRTMRKRLSALNRMSEGRLLRANNDVGAVRKWWVSRVVLEEILAKKRAERQGVANIRQELDRLTGASKDTDLRVDDLFMRTDALNRRLRNQRNEMKKVSEKTNRNTKAIEALKKAASALSEVAEAMIETSPSSALVGPSSALNS